MPVTHVISGTSAKDARVFVYTAPDSTSEYEEFLGYKDITAGDYSIVIPETRPDPILDDDFNGTNGDPPDSTIWNISQGDPVIDNNDLYLEHVASSGVTHEIKSTFTLTGNFQIDLPFDLTGQNNTNGWYLQLSVIDAAGQNGGRIYARYGRRVRTFSVSGGSDTQEGDLNMGASWNSAGVRLSRSGSSWTSGRKSGATWYNNIGHNFTGTTNDVKVEIKSWHNVGLPAFDPHVTYMYTVTGDPVLSGAVMLNIFATVTGTGETSCYGSVEAAESTESVNLNEYPWP